MRKFQIVIDGLQTVKPDYGTESTWDKGHFHMWWTARLGVESRLGH